MEDEIITLKALVKRYGVTSRTIYNWRKNKGFPEPIGYDSNTLYKVADVLAWESRKKAA